MNKRAQVLRAIQQSKKAASVQSLVSEFNLGQRTVERWIPDLLLQNEIIVIREDPETQKRYFRARDYQFMNKWLEGWANAPELGITQWLKDKTRVFQMKNQGDFSDLILDDSPEFQLNYPDTDYQ